MIPRVLRRLRWNARRRLAAHIIRRGSASALGRLTYAIGRGRLLGRLSDTVRSRPDLNVVMMQGYVRAVVTVDFADAATAAQHNLDLVLEICESAGIDAWLVRLRASRRHRIALRETDRARFFSELRRRCVRSPLYVRAYHGTRPPETACLVVDAPESRIDSAAMIDLSELLMVNGSRLRLGFTYGCQVEFWGVEGQHLTGTYPNRIGIAGSPARRSSIQVGERQVPCFATFDEPQFEDVTFDVDAVYTWVDGSDPRWQRRKRAALGSAAVPLHADHAARYRDRQELRYSLRSLQTCAPWIRHIYLVTDGQRPPWLADHPRLTVVDHRDLFPADALPIYNSHAIETRLHTIPGLSDHFIYFNDDVMLGRPVGPDKFFMSNGMSRFFLSRATIPATNVEADTLLASRQRTQGILTGLTGRSANQLMKHTPHAFRKDVLADLHHKIGPEIDATMRHKLRSGDDVVLVWLAHYYGYFTSRAVPSNLTYDYFDVNRSRDRRKMRLLLRRRTLDTFCINDIPNDVESLTAPQFLEDSLAKMFPLPSVYEKPCDAELSAPLPAPALGRVSSSAF